MRWATRRSTAVPSRRTNSGPSQRTRESHCTSSNRPRMGSSSPAASSSLPPHRTVTNAMCRWSATFARRSNPKCVLAFSIPTNSPGLKILAREPVSRWFGSWGHPLQMLDEQDCMLFFDRVLVRWDWLYALRSDADGEDAWCRWRQRQFQLPRLVKSVSRRGAYAPVDCSCDDGGRGDRRHRLSRGRRQARRDGDLLRGLAARDGGD